MIANSLPFYQIALTKCPDKDVSEFFKHGFRPSSRDDLPLVLIQPPLDWSHDPFSDRNWMFQLHGWRMLDPFFNRMEAEDLAFIGEVIADWWRCCQSDQKTTPWFWYDMSTGLRASKLAYLCLWCEQHDQELPLDDATFSNLVREHFKHLTNRRELNRGNHGLFQLNGLMALVDALEQLGQWPKSLSSEKRFALKHMQAVLAEQLGEVGVHTENSPDYHFFIVAKIKRVLSAPWWQLPQMSRAQAMLDKAEVAQHWLVTPGLYCPPVGDSTERKKLKAVERLRDWPHLGQGCSMAAKLDGYAVVRSLPEVKGKHSHYLLFQAGFHTSGHKHADCLSFIWQESGRYLLWDSGKYGYQQDESRAYFQSTRAHNCLEVDGKDYTRRKRHAYGSALRWLDSLEGGWLVGGLVHHRTLSVKHLRLLYFQPGIGVDVLDLLCSRKWGERNYRLWWQLGPDAKVQLTEEGVLAHNPDGLLLQGRFQSSVGETPRYRLWRGDEEPRMAGWVSRDYLVREPSSSCSIEVQTRQRQLAWVSRWRIGSVDAGAAGFRLQDETIVCATQTLASEVALALRELRITRLLAGHEQAAPV